MQLDQDSIIVNSSPFHTIKLLSAGDDGCIKQHFLDVKDTNISAPTKSSTIVKQHSQCKFTSMIVSEGTLSLFVSTDNGDIQQYQRDEVSLDHLLVRTLRGHTRWINQISLSNSKMYLLSASNDGTIRVWDTANGAQITSLFQQRIYEKQNQILKIAKSCTWNSEDTVFAIGMADGEVYIGAPPFSSFNKSDQFIFLLKCKANGDDSFINSLLFQKNGLNLFVSYYDSKIIRLWGINEDMMEQKIPILKVIEQPTVKSLKQNGCINSFDVQGENLVLGADYKLVVLSSVSLKMDVKKQTFPANVHYQNVMSVVFGNSRKYVASGSADGSVAIFEMETGKCVKHFQKTHFNWVRVIHLQC